MGGKDVQLFIFTVQLHCTTRNKHGQPKKDFGIYQTNSDLEYKNINPTKDDDMRESENYSP